MLAMSTMQLNASNTLEEDVNGVERDLCGKEKMARRALWEFGRDFRS